MNHIEYGIHLEEVDWAFSQAYDVLGHTVLVRSNSAELWEHATGVMRFYHETSLAGLESEVTFSFVMDSARQDDLGKSTCYAYYNSTRVDCTSTARNVFRLLHWQLWWCVDELAEQIILHSGAVSKNGAGIILPGKSRSGKSCLTLALVLNNYRYYSDGIAAIDVSTKQLHAFPKVIRVRDVEVFPHLATQENIWLGPEEDDQEPVWWNHPNKVMANPSVKLKPYVGSNKYVHPADIGAEGPGGPINVNYIIFPKYHPFAQPRLRPMSPETALAGLVKLHRNFRKFDTGTLHVLAALVNQAECFSLVSSDLEATVALIDHLVGQ